MGCPNVISKVFFSSFLSCVFLLPTVTAWKRDGCHDRFHISCLAEGEPADVLDLEDVEEIEYICNWVEKKVLNGKIKRHQIPAHAEIFNQYEYEDEECQNVTRAFSYCKFCNYTMSTIDTCARDANNLPCGGKPTVEEVLADEETYWRYETFDDINRTCTVLETVENMFDDSPRTLQLCEMQQVKHLCPGVCEGNCFDSEDHVPSCNPDKSSKGDQSSCDSMWFRSFLEADRDTVLDPSVQMDYLSSLSNVSDNCAGYRESYHRCAWCTGEFCFDENNPPSCQAPDNTSSWDASSESVCHFLFGDLYDRNNPYAIYDLSSHIHSSLLGLESRQCGLAREHYHKCFWCNPLAVKMDCGFQDPCDITAPLPDDFESSTLAVYRGTEEAFCDNVAKGDKSYTAQGCLEDVFLARKCPEQLCPRTPERPEDLENHYLGAKTKSQKLALIWIQRVSAMLSFFGAIYILYDCLSDAKRKSTVYNQLLAGLATFDMVTAISWGLATAPMDQYRAGHVYGAIGNAGTCQAQAFFVQLGLASVFYTVSLMAYYVLVVVYGWRESKLKSVQFYLHGLPWILGFVLAFGGLPIYHWIEFVCYILPPPEGDYWPVMIFIVIPIGFSLVAIAVMVLRVFYEVREQSESEKWRLRQGHKSTMREGPPISMLKAVSWQCLFYVLAFFISWPILFIVYTTSFNELGGVFGLSMTVAFFAPLSGFSNCLVYLRPRLQKKSDDPSVVIAQEKWSEAYNSNWPEAPQVHLQEAIEETKEEASSRTSLEGVMVEVGAGVKTFGNVSVDNVLGSLKLDHTWLVFSPYNGKPQQSWKFISIQKHMVKERLLATKVVFGTEYGRRQEAVFRLNSMEELMGLSMDIAERIPPKEAYSEQAPEKAPQVEEGLHRAQPDIQEISPKDEDVSESSKMSTFEDEYMQPMKSLLTLPIAMGTSRDTMEDDSAVEVRLSDRRNRPSHSMASTGSYSSFSNPDHRQGSNIDLRFQ